MLAPRRRQRGRTVGDAEFIRGWDDLDDFVRRVTEEEVASGGVTPTLAMSFVDDRADLLLAGPILCIESSDEIIRTIIDVFGCIRPERLAVIWPNIFTGDDGQDIHAARINAAEPSGVGSWAWSTRVLFYER